MKWPLLLLCLTLFPFVMAKSGHMTLLTVVQQGDQSITGGTADLYVDVRPGSGRIFIDSFPLTKVDTQISTRLANQVACSYIEMDCSYYDFFYKIEANSPIVGGPSAGAAITVLTISVLKDLKLDNGTVITGTIDTGGLVGPVSGVYEKANAAQEMGYHKILVPKWAPSVFTVRLNLSNYTRNATLNASLLVNETDLLSNLSIQVVKIGNLDQALYEFTGENFSKPYHVESNTQYEEVMEWIAEDLCNRTKNLQAMIDRKKLNYTDDNDFTQRATSAYNSAKYYATASYCFSQNIHLLASILENQSNRARAEKALELAYVVQQLNEVAENQTLRTLSDLETFMIVKERIRETADALASINTSNVSVNLLAYSLERYHSAKVWSQFFGLPGNDLLLDHNHLKEGCQKKINEAEERLSYVEIYAPGYLRTTKEQLFQAYLQREQKSYALCLFSAARAKAEADVFIIASGVDMDQMSQLAEEQIQAAKQVIAKEQTKGLFPILGYSYVEYAENLVHENPISAVTFAQYALELSNLDMYFPQPKLYRLPADYMFFLIMGILIGILVTLLYWRKELFKR